jgi:cell division protein FtsN
MIKHNKKQAGGTLLGIIIGLVVGLGIAVVVAVMITKSSLPFMNKAGKHERAGELTAGQIADPNRPLYGNKQAAKEAAKNFVKEPEVHPTVEDNKVGADKSKPSDMKAGDIKAAESKAKDADKVAVAKTDAKTDSADDKWIYYLQVGAFREQTDAENTKAKLALQGLEAIISEKTSDNGTLYRVRLGPFNQLESLNRVRRKLSESGVDVAIVRIAK